jgi:hypothetical protein
VVVVLTAVVLELDAGALVAAFVLGVFVGTAVVVVVADTDVVADDPDEWPPLERAMMPASATTTMTHATRRVRSTAAR